MRVAACFIVLDAASALRDAALNQSRALTRNNVRSLQSPDAYLPSVMTCANFLKLPDYSSQEVMRERLLLSMREGQSAFLLS